MPESTSFNPAKWLSNSHLQSCLPKIRAPKIKAPLRWEQLDLPDGDFLDLCWAGQSLDGLVVLLHGLEGSVRSHYIRFMANAVLDRGWQAVVMHARGCGGRLNYQTKSYHAAQTEDLYYFLQVLGQRYSRIPIYIVGFSLGGNMMLQTLAKHPSLDVQAAAAISVPFDLSASVGHMHFVYQYYLLRKLKEKASQKIKAGYEIPVSLQQIKKIKSLREFDELITAPINGFISADEYYSVTSCRQILKKIQIPTLILNAVDDPFVPEVSIPNPTELSSQITLNITNFGGHTGFIENGFLKPKVWFPDRVLQFFDMQR
jgi:uncharacterized protein